MPKLFRVTNHPYLHNALLHYSHRHNNERMTIDPQQDSWLPIHFRNPRSERPGNITKRGNRKPCNRLRSMQGACGCSSYFTSAIGPHSDIRGEEPGQTIKVTLFDSIQELPQELMVMLSRWREARALGRNEFFGSAQDLATGHLLFADHRRNFGIRIVKDF